ncbi:Ubiquitin carboxyl-terminal hydrolase 15 [Ananas comosus]|uniref:Ubiquitin carboxyl-terminal hydrolase 15 n=1 Tax=Ananas comosus TaxID=4615 RepID=A0A199W8L3_ANACO|nr:Ubiquitin carboxyl-terminal hydrolase 15 [Ananas comosus]
MSMQSSCLEGLGGEKELDPRLQETTLIQQIFGVASDQRSSASDAIMSLRDTRISWILLWRYMDGWSPGRCPNTVYCSRGFRWRKHTGQFGKINKCVTFPDMLDMIPFAGLELQTTPPLYFCMRWFTLDTQNASFADIMFICQRYARNMAKIDTLRYAFEMTLVFPRPPRVYIEKQLLQASSSSKLNTPKSQKASKSEQHKQSEIPSVEDATSWVYDFRLEFREDNNKDQTGPFTDTYSVDFSDATTTSSDWSFFTSSDESSFTTESTRIH